MRRSFLAAVLVGFVALALGCMSFSFGEHKEVITADGPYTKQTGKLTVPAGKELSVYYPAAFQSSPNLVVDDNFHQCQVLEQRPDGFRVRNSAVLAHEIEWTARGVRPPAAPVVEVAAPARPQE